MYFPPDTTIMVAIVNRDKRATHCLFLTHMVDLRYRCFCCCCFPLSFSEISFIKRTMQLQMQLINHSGGTLVSVRLREVIL